MLAMASLPRRQGLARGGHGEPGTDPGPYNHENEAQAMRMVMIVDDQSTGRKILEELVHSIDRGLEVESYADPREAVERARERMPDLVLTDYKMPVMDGVEFTRQLRAIPGCGDVPLIMVTVVEDRRVRYDALEAGATDFLTRPIDHHECRARCRNLLTLRRQQQVIKSRARWLEQQVFVATKKIRVREQETLLRLAKAGEYRDQDTGNHILRMAKYSRFLAEELGLPEAACDEVELAAPMHDIGKIGIPDEILLKPGRLSPREMDVMRRHTLIGYEILKDSPSRYLQQGAVIAVGHHERYDGSGYPKGLRGEEIPMVARIVAVADVYDALTSVRPYKPAWPSEEAVGYVTTQRARHFDPQCVDAFLARLDSIREVQAILRDGGVVDEG
jgi:two-component system response regulator RpfG